jgi:hypothetical protein
MTGTPSSQSNRCQLIEALRDRAGLAKLRPPWRVENEVKSLLSVSNLADFAKRFSIQQSRNFNPAQVDGQERVGLGGNAATRNQGDFRRTHDNGRQVRVELDTATKITKPQSSI